MRKFVASSLIALLVALPVLACCCPPEPQINTKMSHEHHAGEQGDTKHVSQDCSKADHQLSNKVVNTATPELKIQFQLDSAAIHYSGEEPFFLVGDRILSVFIASSPPDTPLPVFLTTQRLRI